MTYHVALLNLLAAACITSLKLGAGGSQLSYRSGVLLHGIAVCPDRSFKPCLHEELTDHSIAPQHTCT